MKRILLIVLFLIANTVLFGFETKRDVITQFLTEYIDGKPTGGMKYIEITLDNINNKIFWFYTEIYFNSIDYEKSTRVSVIQSRSDDNFSIPVLSDVKWKPGEKLTCKIDCAKDCFELIAIKKDKTRQFDWSVSGGGKFRQGNGETHVFEWRGSKDYQLLFSKLKLEALYYK
jgi:hypothetical protein